LILSVDLGTSLAKVGLWGQDGLLAVGRSKLETTHGPDGRTEQNPVLWWPAVRAAARRALSEASRATDSRGSGIEAIGFSAARQSFVPVDSQCRPIGDALMWSDRRAGAEAAVLNELFGGTAKLRQRTGIYHDSGSVAAKLAWLARHEPARLGSARWLLAPRDAVVFELTGEVATDVTLASASGLYDDEGLLAGDIVRAALSLDGSAAAELEALLGDPAWLFPQPRSSDCIVGELLADPAGELGLSPGIPVVLGAGDRACETLGTGASAERPMVSWGTTANVSVPRGTRPTGETGGLIVTRSADGRWLLEGGLSAAGSLLEWIGGLVGLDVAELARRAEHSPVGARGVVVLPWLGGARAPWWCPTANAAVLGLRTEHDSGDLTRAAVEGVAYDVARCIDAACDLHARRGGAAIVRPDSLVLGGSGSTVATWVQILAAVTGLPALRRRSGEAASAGAALLAASAVGVEMDLDRMDPVVAVFEPDPADVALYGHLRPLADRLAAESVASATLGTA
jgi:xylulokinase